MLTQGNYVMTQESKDYSRARNGGEYEFGYYPVLKNDREVGRLQSTSAGFDYCEITGRFTRTVMLDVENANFKVCVDAQMVDPEINTLSESEFLDMLGVTA